MDARAAIGERDAGPKLRGAAPGCGGTFTANAKTRPMPRLAAVPAIPSASSAKRSAVISFARSDRPSDPHAYDVATNLK